jgi:hypothetical protein
LQTKKAISIIVALSLLFTLMPLLIPEVYAYDQQHNNCTHLHMWGESLEWTPYDEFTAVGIGAYMSGDNYVEEDFFFRRGLGFCLPPEAFADGPLKCYMWMEGGYNYWPYNYYNDWIEYEWIDNPSPPPDGMFYNYQQYNRTVYFETSEIWAAAESWYYDFVGYQWWQCFSYAHLPGGYP